MPKRAPTGIDVPIPHLDTFARAAEERSFTRAAESLGLTQAAVSQHIQAIELLLGVPLFHRRGGRVELSTAGRRLYRYAQRILALHREAREKIAGQTEPLAGRLTIAASSIPGEHILPGVLAAFRQTYPDIQVAVRVADSAAVLKDVEQGKCDLGFVGTSEGARQLDFQPFTCDQMVLVVPAGHPLGRRKRISLRELARQPLIIREPGSGSRWCLEQSLHSAGQSLEDLKIVLELGSNEGIKDAVLRGMGLAVLSERVVEKELERGQLHALELSNLPLKRRIYVVRDPRRALAMPARVFLHFLELPPAAGR